MTNPARELHEIFAAWSQTVDSAPTQARGLKSGDGWNTQIRSILLVHAIDSELDAMEARGQRVDTFRDARSSWLRMIFAYPEGWTATTATRVLKERSRMDVLDSLAVVFDVAGTAVPPGQADSLDRCLVEVLALLERDESIEAPLREILFDLVSEAQRALADFRTTGRFDRVDIVRRLWVALWAADAQSTQKGEWSKLAQYLWAPATAGFLGSLPGVVTQVLTSLG